MAKYAVSGECVVVVCPCQKSGEYDGVVREVLGSYCTQNQLAALRSNHFLLSGPMGSSLSVPYQFLSNGF